MALGRLFLEEESVEVVYENTGVLKTLGAPGPKLMNALRKGLAANLITEDGQMKTIEFTKSGGDGTVRIFFRR